jgi:hypothetical protein
VVLYYCNLKISVMGLFGPRREKILASPLGAGVATLPSHGGAQLPLPEVPHQHQLVLPKTEERRTTEEHHAVGASQPGRGASVSLVCEGAALTPTTSAPSQTCSCTTSCRSSRRGRLCGPVCCHGGGATSRLPYGASTSVSVVITMTRCQRTSLTLCATPRGVSKAGHAPCAVE